MKQQIVHCLDCQGEISLQGTVLPGEVVTCPDCSTDFEITNLKPITIEHAPEVQEDWGE